MKTIENGCEEQYGINRWINTIRKEVTNENKCVKDNKTDSKYIPQLKKSLSLENLAVVKNSFDVKHDVKIKHDYTILEPKEINDDKSSVSNNIHEDNSEMITFINNLVNIVCYFSTDDPKDNFSGKTNNFNAFSQKSESNSNDLSNSTSVSQMKINIKETLSPYNNNEFNQSIKVTRDNSQLNSTSSSNNLGIVENSNDDSHFTRQIPNVVRDSFQIKNNSNILNTEELKITKIENNTTYNSLMSMMNEDTSTNKNTNTQNVTKSTNNIQMKNDFDSNNDEFKAKMPQITCIDDIKNSANLNSERISDIFTSANKNTMTKVLKRVKRISKKKFSELETLLNNKDLTFTVRTLLIELIK